MINSDQIVKERLKATSISCFIKYYETFRDNKNQNSNENIIDAFKNNREVWTMKSYRSRASKGKAIFRDNLEKLALEYIGKLANKNKIDYKIVEKAQNLLENYSEI